MRWVGVLLLCLGVVVSVIGWNMGTVVPSGSDGAVGAFRAIHNLGLLDGRRDVLWLGQTALLLGAVFYVGALIKDELQYLRMELYRINRQ